MTSVMSSGLTPRAHSADQNPPPVNGAFIVGPAPASFSTILSSYRIRKEPSVFSWCPVQVSRYCVKGAQSSSDGGCTPPYRNYLGIRASPSTRASILMVPIIIVTLPSVRQAADVVVVGIEARFDAEGSASSRLRR